MVTRSASQRPALPRLALVPSKSERGGYSRQADCQVGQPACPENMQYGDDLSRRRLLKLTPLGYTEVVEELWPRSPSYRAAGRR